MDNWNYQTGVPVTDLSLTEKLSIANLDWEVKRSPITYGDFGEHEASDKFAVYRSDTNDLIDIYGSNRQCRSNQDIVNLIDQIFVVGGFKMNNLGSYDHGAYIYASADLPCNYDINVKQVGDIIQPRLVIVDSHYNNEGLKVYTHFNRLVCTNGMTRKVSQKVGVISHAGGINKSIVKKVLAAAINSVRTKSQLSDFLADQVVGVMDAQAQLIAAFGDPEKSIDEQPAMIKTVLELYQGNAVGGDMLSAYYTAYGLLQSLTEYYNHHSTTKSQTTRFQSIMSGDYARASSNFERQLVKAYQ